MKKERESNSNINLSVADGVPKVSFKPSGAASENLVSERYDISENEFTAYYDGAHRLIFVLDETLDARKPNVLLVINPVGERKWDDILSNDYAVDLETIRPKKDNKYQKLDIEYSGLSIYNDLINAHNSKTDLTAALAELSNFRNMSVRRAAAERLSASAEIIVKSNETISKTDTTLRDLQARLKKLREKLVRQKKEVGKEPTKQSAAKILKTESQIEATNEKLRRSKRRLKNAHRRLIVAEEDAEISRAILRQKEYFVDIPKTEIKEEPKVENMVDEVKPLFDKDPEILDDKIAFKPVDFSAPADTPVYVAPEPIPVPEYTPTAVPEPMPEPFPASDEPVSFEPIPDVPPAPLSFTTHSASQPYEPAPEPTPVPEPEFEPAPIETTRPIPAPEFRPTSPITGGPAVPVADVGARQRPGAMYYIMLILLIALSIFTLWLYQKKTAVDMPGFMAEPEIQAPVAQPAPPPVVESPFIQTDLPPQPVVTEPEPVVVEPEPVEYVEETPVTVMPQEAPVGIAEPVYQPAPVTVAPPAPTPVVVNKPEYDVSGRQMFVADDNYDPGYDNQYYDDGQYYEDGYDEYYEPEYDEYTEEHQEEVYENYSEEYYE